MLGSNTFCIWLIPHHGAYRLQWCLSDGHITLVDFLSQLIFLWWNPLISQGVLQVFRTPGNLHLFTFFFESFPDIFTRGLRSCIIWSLYLRPENIFGWHQSNNNYLNQLVTSVEIPGLLHYFTIFCEFFLHFIFWFFSLASRTWGGPEEIVFLSYLRD